MVLAVVYGTRPEFLKLKKLIDKLRSSIVVIKIAQHIVITGDDGYYDHVIDITELCEDRMSNIAANIMMKLPVLLKMVGCTKLLAQGDTATVFYSLLCAFQMKITCFHLEAGMRTHNLDQPFPEEGYRQMISRITNIHLCPSTIEFNMLEQEHVGGSKYVVGNTILDLVASYDVEIKWTKTVLITLHRREKWDSFTEYIEQLFELAAINSDFTFIFLTHPNPELIKIVDTVKTRKNVQNITVAPPVDHETLIGILAKCACVITDSGGIQEEANFLGKHIYILRDVTERVAINPINMSLVPLDRICIDINCNVENHGGGLEYGNGKSIDKICGVLGVGVGVEDI